MLKPLKKRLNDAAQLRRKEKILARRMGAQVTQGKDKHRVRMEIPGINAPRHRMQDFLR